MGTKDKQTYIEIREQGLWLYEECCKTVQATFVSMTMEPIEYPLIWHGYYISMVVKYHVVKSIKDDNSKIQWAFLLLK